MTLIELVVAIVIISISLTGTLLLVDTTTRRSADPLLDRQAISIGQAYLEEILQKAYTDPDDGALCPPAEAARSLYDNICDYAGLNELGARNQSGAVVVGLEGFRIEINVDTSASLAGLTGPGEVLRVDATVTDPTLRVFQFSGYRTSL